MTVWIDGDSCPRQVRDIVNSRCMREKIPVHYVANRELPLPESELILFTMSSAATDSADKYILDHSLIKDLIITRDIPLASTLVEQGKTVINDRGTLFTKNNIRERLAQRDFMQMMREAGIEQDKGRNFGAKEVKCFSSCFDRILVQKIREERFRKTSL